MLDFIERQHAQVGDIGQKVQRNDQCRAAGKGQWDGSPWIPYFARSECDVVPCIRREERTYLRYAKSDEQPERASRGDNRRKGTGVRLNFFHAMWSPKICEIGF